MEPQGKVSGCVKLEEAEVGAEAKDSGFAIKRRELKRTTQHS